MKINDILTVKIIDIDHEALGIAKVDSLPIFINNALPGEEIKVRITKTTKNIAVGENLEILSHSENRTIPLCEHYVECGGCNMLHFKYDYELEHKKKDVETTIFKVASLKPQINEVVINDKRYHYRNKVIVPFADNGQIISGFYKPLSHDVVEITNCLIEPLITQRIIKDFKDLLAKNNITIYDEATNTGLVRNIMFRLNWLGEIMVVVVVSNFSVKVKDIMLKLIDSYKEIVSMYQNINNKQTNVVLSKDYIHIYGSKELVEDINGLKFIVGPGAFMQVNHDQCEKLYNIVLNYCNLTGNENVIDAYCGMGSITLNLAKKARYVYGIEIVEEAINNANNNKKLNNITNVDFICGKCEEKIKQLVDKEKIDVIVFDPPRKGCESEFLKTVVEMRIPKIVYISCKCSTFARDAKYLVEQGYILKEITPVDLFSGTNHIETVAMLCLKTGQ